MSYNFQIGLTYSFEVYPSAILGTDFKNVKVLAILDKDSANQIISTQSMHVNVYPYLPAGTPNSPAGYNYIKILTQSGATTCIGIPWIKESTISVVEFKRATAVIDGVTLEDGPKIAAALLKNGYPNVKINFE